MVTVIALPFTGCGTAAAAVTPRVAYRIVSQCMTRAGATSVHANNVPGGIARFPGFYKVISWADQLDSSGQVVRITALTTVNHRIIRKVNRCLRPHGWKLDRV